ncbi:hypothetical protein AHAS_Ahas06G0138500 [Arachis hypogaea]
MRKTKFLQMMCLMSGSFVLPISLLLLANMSISVIKSLMLAFCARIAYLCLAFLLPLHLSRMMKICEKKSLRDKGRM